MKKDNQTIYVCADCGEEYSKWQGKCNSCGSWNTLKELKISHTKTKIGAAVEVINLSKIEKTRSDRISTKIGEMDRVLGGGLVAGSVVLLGGEPGIGKSTLLLELASNLEHTFYVSGEESPQQIKMRSDRLKVEVQNIELISETNVDAIINALSKNKPNLVIIDSVQTMYTDEYPSTAGSIVQVRECALRLQKYAKQNFVPIILVGHVTKDGTVAGPKTLEHMVDVVLYLEGEKFHDLRVLRTTKNRYGATDEVGLFEIKTEGMCEVKNPSKIFLADYDKKNPGTVIFAAIEGTRPLLLEIQALTTPTVFGYPKRTASGFDLNRLQLIIAVLINRGGLNLSSQDVYLNVSGGIYVKEPAADLAVALAIVSAYRNKIIAKNMVVFGELTLNGDIRAVPQENKRLAEAKRLGFIAEIKSKTIAGAVKETLNE